jgi:hypothetical protein
MWEEMSVDRTKNFIAKKNCKGEWGRRIKTGMRMGFEMGLI